jgi:hypothetical protein
MIKFTETDSGRISSGYTHEHNDCTVRALAEATGASYAQAHSFWTKLGRTPRSGSYMSWLDEYLTKNNDEVFGWKVVRHKIPYHDHERERDPITRKPTIKRVNVKTFIQQNPKGRFMTINRCHAKAIVDGEIRDLDQGIYSELMLVYEFKDSRFSTLDI